MGQETIKTNINWFPGHMVKALKEIYEKQKDLYDDFCKKRDDFYSIAGEIYQRKF